MRYQIETTRPNSKIASDPLLKSIFHDEDAVWEKAKALAPEADAQLFVRYEIGSREYTVPVLS